MSEPWCEEKHCLVCNKNQTESIEHFVLDCPGYDDVRNQMIGTLLQNLNSKVLNLFLQRTDINAKVDLSDA